MSLSDKKLSFNAMRNAVKEAANKVSVTAQSIDINGVIANVKETAASVADLTASVSTTAYAGSKAKVISTYEMVSEEARSFDYAELRRVEYYQERYTDYRDLGSKKVSEYFRSTFEVDKSTMEMVDDLRNRLPVPAKTIDDIFEQCKCEAIQRAIAAFALSGVVQDIDNRSASKYDNLSESYKEFKGHSAYSMIDDPNFKAMQNDRYDARMNWTELEDGYNKDFPLDPRNAGIDHVIAKKELYDDKLLRVGTTNEELFSLMNSCENLVFADDSFNKSLGATNIHDYVAKNGRTDLIDPNLVHFDITQKDGSIKTVTASRQDIEETYNLADARRNEHRLAAAKEVAFTVLKTGMVMSAQQVVGLIVLETIDIFIDEVRNLTVNGRVINEDGWLKNTKESTARVHQRLAERFEERDIWSRARTLGIESGVAGSLSVIPQILISLIAKMPSFVLAIIRECTLSTVRCVRVLTSGDANKFESMKVILAGSASAIVSVYVGSVISKAIAGVPLLNRFDAQVTSVLTGLVVTAVPLTAIYTFDQNKSKLSFIMSRFTGAAEQTT